MDQPQPVQLYNNILYPDLNKNLQLLNFSFKILEDQLSDEGSINTIYYLLKQLRDVGQDLYNQEEGLDLCNFDKITHEIDSLKTIIKKKLEQGLALKMKDQQKLLKLFLLLTENIQLMMLAKVKSQLSFNVVEQLVNDDHIKLKEKQIFRLKYDDYYYENNDGTKQFGGCYWLNEKQGVWLDVWARQDQSQSLQRKITTYFFKGRKQYILSRNILMVYNQGNGIKDQKWLIIVGKISQFINIQKKQLNVNWTKRRNLLKGEWFLSIVPSIRRVQGQYEGWRTEDLFLGRKNGQGSYNQIGLKDGQWTEPSPKYQLKNKVSYSDKYKDGLKIGVWNINYEGTVFRGGSYDEEGMKQGKWVELHENFNYYCNVILVGQYENNNRSGFWTISYREKKIGGGKYDNGIKIGNWKTNYTLNRENKQEIGDFDENGRKTGTWVDLHDNFNNQGMRVKKWITSYNKNEIGGGKYESGVKTGEWTDLHDDFNNECQVTFKGEYSNGQRSGKWITSYKDENEQRNIGGGQYDDNGIKTGEWTDLHENFYQNCQVTLKGEFKDGLRNGLWEIMERKKETKENEKIGGGKYDEEGFKTGQWEDIHHKFNINCNRKFQGQFLNGVRTGDWIIFDNDKIRDKEPKINFDKDYY